MTWMPYFHDYGLVEGLLEPLYNGTPCYVMSPFAFVKRPAAWLQAITRFHGTHSQAPNFAYDLCVRRISPRSARRPRPEPSGDRPATPPSRSTQGPGGHSTRPSAPWASGGCANCPAYGLAEATLVVSSSSPSEDPVLTELLRPPRWRQTESSRGRPARRGRADGGRLRPCLSDDHRARDRPSRVPDPMRPDEVGEIWVADPAVAEGYWQRPEETEQIFRATIAGTGKAPSCGRGISGSSRTASSSSPVA